MPSMRLAFRFAPLVLAAAALACDDENALGPPQRANAVDTVSLGSLIGTPISTPSGFSVTAGTVRTDQSADFDFAYNIDPGGRSVFLPRAVLGLPSSTTADPGLQRQTASFNDIVVARSNGYVTDDTVAIAVGDVFVVRGRVSCGGLGVPLYAKIEVIGLHDATVDLQVLANTNCGYKGLEPGLPDR